MPRRPAVSIEESASRAWSGAVSSARCAPCAWITITPMLCATRSCSSRAMRARSSVTALTACSCLPRSASSARSVNAAAASRTEVHPPTESPHAEQDEPRRDHLVPRSAVPKPGDVYEDRLEYDGRRTDEGERPRRVRAHGVQRDDHGEEGLTESATELELQPCRSHDGHEDGHREPAADEERKGERRSQDRVNFRASHQTCRGRDPELDNRRDGEGQHDHDVDEQLQPDTRHGSTVVIARLPHIHIAADAHRSGSAVRGTQRPASVLTTRGAGVPTVEGPATDAGIEGSSSWCRGSS